MADDEREFVNIEDLEGEDFGKNVCHRCNPSDGIRERMYEEDDEGIGENALMVDR